MAGQLPDRDPRRAQGYRRAAAPDARAGFPDRIGEARGLACPAAFALCARACCGGRRSDAACRRGRTWPARCALGGRAGATLGKLPRAACVAGATSLSRAAAPRHGSRIRARFCRALPASHSGARAFACRAAHRARTGRGRSCGTHSQASRAARCRAVALANQPTGSCSGSLFISHPCQPTASSASRHGRASSLLRSRSSRRRAC